ncbi:MAG: spermidine/putrescine transport system permease protein [Nocardioidaceae bacterium]|nr:spermidine/putrescine transport system permease protein [Nocardioidaceae bacterium]
MTALGHVPTPGAVAPDREDGHRRGITGYLLMLPGTVWLAIFFVVPTITLVASSLYDPSGSLLNGYQMTWHFQNYTDALQTYASLFVRSFLYALIATVTCIILGFPLAYAIAFKAGRWRNLMLVAVIAPFFTSFLVRTLSWKLLLSDNGFIVSALNAIPGVPEHTRLLATPFAVVTGLAYNFLPFMVLPLYASLEKIDVRLLEAASDLYSSPFTGFRKVTLPLAMPGLVAGTLLTFIPAAGDFVNAELLGNPRTRMIGNTIQELFLQAGDVPTASALSVSLMVVIVAMVLIYVRRAGTEELV